MMKYKYAGVHKSLIDFGNLAMSGHPVGKPALFGEIQEFGV